MVILNALGHDGLQDKKQGWVLSWQILSFLMSWVTAGYKSKDGSRTKMHFHFCNMVFDPLIQNSTSLLILVTLGNLPPDIPQNCPWITQENSLDKNNSNTTFCSEFSVFFLCYRNNEEFTSLFIRKVRLEKDTPTWHRHWIRTIRISETKTKNCKEHINHIIQKRTI